MAQTRREAMMLNNLGTERFAAGEFAGAMDAFRGALTFIPNNPNRMGAVLRDSVATEPSSLGIAFRSVDESPPPEDGEPFVYHKPLVFNRLIPETQDGAAAFCGVVVFNMALTMDIKAKGGNSAVSDKALHLYSSCLNLFSKTSSRVDLTSAMAAACNNKARIYFERCSFEDSNRELQHLQNFLRVADTSPTKKEILEEDDCQGMLLNLLLLWPPTIALAA